MAHKAGYFIDEAALDNFGVAYLNGINDLLSNAGIGEANGTSTATGNGISYAIRDGAATGSATATAVGLRTAAGIGSAAGTVMAAATGVSFSIGAGTANGSSAVWCSTVVEDVCDMLLMGVGG